MLVTITHHRSGLDPDKQLGLWAFHKARHALQQRYAAAITAEFPTATVLFEHSEDTGVWVSATPPGIGRAYRENVEQRVREIIDHIYFTTWHY